jgi:hypothetical protein
VCQHPLHLAMFIACSFLLSPFRLPLAPPNTAAAAVAAAAVSWHLDPGPDNTDPFPTIFWKSDQQTVAGVYGKNGSKVNSRFRVSLNLEGNSHREALSDRARVSAARAQAAAAALLAGDHVLCDCGQAVTELSSRTPKNPGRRFMACPKPRGEVTRCDFFVWRDQVEQCRQQLLRRQRQPQHP